MLTSLLTTAQGPFVAFVNAVFGLLIAFNVVLTQTQLAAVDLVCNAGFVLAAVIYAAVKGIPTPAPAKK